METSFEPGMYVRLVQHGNGCLELPEGFTWGTLYRVLGVCDLMSSEGPSFVLVNDRHEFRTVPGRYVRFIELAPERKVARVGRLTTGDGRLASGVLEGGR